VLDEQGIFQWTDNYPVFNMIEQDIRAKHLYCFMVQKICVGIVSLNTLQDPEYSQVNWSVEGKILIIHRLAVDPAYQKQGIAGKLMDFAEHYAKMHNYVAIRLDAYSQNTLSIAFYEHRNYQKRGEVFFTGRRLPFFCYEKPI
jgi:ribosomal protein S18 acetylase RimI-like enzyme